MLRAGSAGADEAEDRAIAAIEKLGGKVTRDPKKAGSPVIAVDLRSRKVTDKDLESLQGLKAVESLVLSNNRITDAGLAHLKGLRTLRSLKLDFTGITDKGLEHLKSLQQLEYLHIGYTQVKKEARAKLQEALPKLKIQGP
jgi:hypothetical protein